MTISARFVSRNASFLTKCVIPQRPDLDSLTANAELATGTEKMQRRMRRYICRVPNSVSSPAPLNCGDAACLTSCHRAFVSNSCHFSGPGRNHPDGPAEVLGQRPGVYAQFRHVTAGTRPSPGRITQLPLTGILVSTVGGAHDIDERLCST